MSHPLIVIAAEEAGALRTLLDSLQPVRHGSDQVIVVGPEALAVTCRRASRTRLVARDALTADDIAGRAVLRLTTDARPSGDRWLSELTRAAGHDAVAVPMTNGAPWPRCPLDAPLAEADRSAIRSFSRTVEQSGRGRRAPVADLSGPCVMVGAAVVARLDPSLLVAPVQQLDHAVGAAGVERVLASGAYVHDTTAVLISACMIMKDEIDNLPTCLAGLEHLVDDIVIYDTGSTDGSVELARRLGALVIEGYWDDDFGRARNAALAHCRGTWVVHLDADECVEDPMAAGTRMRTILAEATNADVVAVNLFNLEGSRIAPVRSSAPNLVARFLRRDRCHWRGALHEEPVARPGQPGARYTRSDALTLLHSGYLAEAIDERGKRHRNLRISRHESERDGDSDTSRFNLARSLLMAHRHSEAVDLFDDLGRTSAHDVIRRSSIELGSDALRDLGRHHDALEWGRRHSAENPQLHVGRLLQAKALVQIGEVAEAAALIDGITEYNDRYSNVGADGLAVFRAAVHTHLGDHRAALSQLTLACRTNVRTPQLYAGLARLCAQNPTIDPSEVMTLVPVTELTSVFAQLLDADRHGADRIADSVWHIHSQPMAALAFASELATHLDVERATVWAVRLRSAGLAASCPLPAIAADPQRPTADVAVALAALVALGEEIRRDELEDVVRSIATDELPALLGRVLDVAADAADSVIVAASTGTERARCLVEPLVERGHYTEAVAVYGFAARLDTSPLRSLDHDVAAQVLQEARAIGRTDVEALLS